MDLGEIQIRPKVFIGSSTRSRDIALAMKIELESAADAPNVSVWGPGTFELTHNILEELISALNEFQFGIFVFSPDDLVMINGQEHTTVRDNVLFELGMFIGRLGKSRCYFVTPKSKSNLHITSDLEGIISSNYDDINFKSDKLSSVSSACFQIRNSINQEMYRSLDPIIDQLSNSLVYMLRCISIRKYHTNYSEFSFSLYEFDNSKSGDLDQGWRRASEYAARFLRTLGLIEYQGKEFGRIKITGIGKMVLEYEKTKNRYERSFDKPTM